MKESRILLQEQAMHVRARDKIADKRLDGSVTARMLCTSAANICLQ